MPISSSDLAGVQSALKDPTSTLSSPVSSILASAKDPIGLALTKTLSSINSLTTTISDKITNLEKDLVKSADKTGKVALVGNTIVVTLQPADAAKLPQYQAKIQKDVDKINSSISKLRVVTDTLKVVSESAKIVRTALDVQELMLTIGNPVAKATMTLIKSALKILFYKDVLNEYVSILTQQMASAEQSFSTLVSKFSKLSVKFVVASDLNNGIVTTPDQAQTALQLAALNTNKGNVPQAYTSNDGREFILSVETYGIRELIGRARDKYSSLLVVETSPSFVSTADQLIEELKVILNQ